MGVSFVIYVQFCGFISKGKFVNRLHNGMESMPHFGLQTFKSVCFVNHRQGRECVSSDVNLIIRLLVATCMINDEISWSLLSSGIYGG